MQNLLLTNENQCLWLSQYLSNLIPPNHSWSRMLWTPTWELSSFSGPSLLTSFIPVPTSPIVFFCRSQLWHCESKISCHQDGLGSVEALAGGGHPAFCALDRPQELVQTAKWLNSCQARWALFYSRFNFILIYSREKIEYLPSTALWLQVHVRFRRVRQTLKQDLDPGRGPPGCLYVFRSAHTPILNWSHKSQFVCHSGINGTSNPLEIFMGRTLDVDSREFAGLVCAQSKCLHQPPSGLLQPLPIPGRPWTHIALDYIADLFESQGKTVILIIVNWISKAVCLVAESVQKELSAPETAWIIFDQVFRISGISLDIVSDQGPQFTSRVWKAFCNTLKAWII